jgi:DNA-binding response OmpR family regulator
MTASPTETWVLCGGATHAHAPADALRLSVGDDGDSMTVDIAGVSQALTGQLSARFTDLIRLAAFVLGADGAVSRGKLDDADGGKKWHRAFRLVVAVEDPPFWSQTEVTTALEETLSFLSQDTFSFEFQQLNAQKGQKKKIGEQLVFSTPGGKPFLPWNHIEEISLFSGGLDSFAGAAELILRQKRGTILVSHRSATKMWATQSGLVEDLRSLAQSNNARAPEHVAVEVTRHNSILRTERSQRTRSFLYAAIAGAVANLVSRNRVCMYENGVIGINLPIAGSVVGARATRTAHPRVLGGFSKILTHVAGATFTVDNPFALKTRAEIIQGLSTSPALPLAKQTMSCAHIHRRSQMHPHCGVCSQCIDRQFGFLGAGMEQHDSGIGYELKLATDEWKDDGARSLLLNWIGTADDFASCKNGEQFIEKFGDASRAIPNLMEAFSLDADGARRAVFDLHKRHGDTVARVLEAIHARSAKDIRDGKLKPTTLPLLLYREGMRKQRAVGAQAAQGAENQFRIVDGEWHLRFRCGQAFTLPETKGLHLLGLLLANPGEARTTAALLALAQGRDPAGCHVLDAAGKQAVRERVAALKKERDEAEEFCDQTTVTRCQAEMDALSALLKGKASDVGVDDKVACATEKEVGEAIAAIAKQSKPLGDHLKEFVQVGSVFWYRGPGIAWDIALPAASQAATTSETTDGGALVIDLQNQRVTFRGHEIPTSPPNHLQPQAILALAALAQRPGEALSMADVATGIWKLGGLAKKPTSPDQRDLKYKLTNPFTKALPNGEAKTLIQAVRGTGLRLNLPAAAVRVVLRDGGGGEKS